MRATDGEKQKTRYFIGWAEITEEQAREIDRKNRELLQQAEQTGNVEYLTGCRIVLKWEPEKWTR